MSSNMSDTTRQLFNRIKSGVEELEVQMSLGKKEATEQFEGRKKDLDAYLGELKGKLREAEKRGGENLTELRAAIDELRVQLNLGRADTLDRYNEQKQKIEASSARLKAAMAANMAKMSGELEEQLDSFRAKMQALRVQFTLAGYETRDELERQKDIIRQKAEKLKATLRKEREHLDERFEHAGKDFSKAAEHAKKAFDALFK